MKKTLLSLACISILLVQSCKKDEAESPQPTPKNNIFPVNVKAVYIRQTGSSKKEKAVQALKNLETLNVKVCYFKKSSEAIAHSRAIGLIS